MADPPAPHRPGEPDGARRNLDKPPNRPDPDDVSVPVMTVSAPSDVVVDRTAGVGSGAAVAHFDELFRTHYDRLVRSLTVVCGDRERAADAVQEAFVKAHVRWRRIGRYDDPVGWVRRVAINQLRDEHRRAGRRRLALTRLAARPPAAGPPDEPDELGRLLAELPRQQRVATALFYVDGISVAEIAGALGVAEGTVKSHLHDARRRLRAVLDDEHRSEPGR